MSVLPDYCQYVRDLSLSARGGLVTWHHLFVLRFQRGHTLHSALLQDVFCAYRQVSERLS